MLYCESVLIKCHLSSACGRAETSMDILKLVSYFRCIMSISMLHEVFVDQFSYSRFPRFILRIDGGYLTAIFICKLNQDQRTKPSKI